MKTILITGASRGIGQACARRAAELGMSVIVTARSQNSLQNLSSEHPGIQAVAADLSSQEGRRHLASQIQQPLDCILHNAARLDAPRTLQDLSADEFRAQMSINAEPILFLTQKLMPNLKAGTRILAVSSGAAKRAILGLGNYCTSKAAGWMATEMLRSEMLKYEVLVNHYFPGVVDTDMQKTLRSSVDEVFEFATEFRKYHADKQLNTPTDVAADILRIFTETSDADFFNSEWQMGG